jgi:hypothetical protein
MGLTAVRCIHQYTANIHFPVCHYRTQGVSGYRLRDRVDFARIPYGPPCREKTHECDDRRFALLFDPAVMSFGFKGVFLATMGLVDVSS